MNATIVLPAYPIDQQQEVLNHCRFTQDQAQLPWQILLCQVLGFDTSDANCLSYAKLVLADGANPNVSEKLAVQATQTAPVVEHSSVRADPVCLKADRDNATLLPAQQLAVSDDEADTLLDSLNDFFNADGLTFHRRSAQQWYLSGEFLSILCAYPPSFLAHRNAAAFLPAGEEHAHWRRLLTEIQMILHTHPVNQQRERKGLPAINSLWFWGGGDMSNLQRPTQAKKISVYCDHDAYVDGLLAHAGMTALPKADILNMSNGPATAPADAHENTRKEAYENPHKTVPRNGSVQERWLIDNSVMDAWLQSDQDAMQQAIEHIDESLLKPLMASVAKGHIQQLTVCGEDGVVATASFSAQQYRRPSIFKRWIDRFRP